MGLGAGSPTFGCLSGSALAKTPQRPRRSVTLDQGQLDQARLEALGLKTTIVKQPAVVAGLACTSGQIPRLTGFERPPAAARLVAGPVDSACAASLHFPIGTLKVAASPGALVSDTFEGERATAYHVRDRGLVVITSCGHAGVINSARQARRSRGSTRCTRS
jgi:7,8-dihydropterin-6-yl-methyl-4-(beta-D-ribofuranosyl)aminobenzene 5'-phosphate synthase